jgi:hypothetical protein
MNMFNNQGEMNASSLRDLAQNLAKYASILENNTPSNMGMAGQPSLSDEKRDELISRAIMTQDGKIALAQAMANPISIGLGLNLAKCWNF